MNTRRALIHSLNATEQELWQWQAEVNEHKGYWSGRVAHHHVTFAMTLLGAFWFGWNKGYRQSMVGRIGWMIIYDVFSWISTNALKSVHSSLRRG